MTAPKYVGYLGGAAVAAGVGMAIAVGGVATAHAEGTDTKSDSKSESTSAESNGPKKERSTGLGKAAAKLEKRAAKVARDAREAREARLERVAKFDPAEAVKDLQKRFDKAAKPADEPEVTDAEAKPKRLDLAARAAAAAQALAPAKEAPEAAVVPDVETRSGTDDLFSNPFRPDDPEPTPAGMFGPFLDIREAVLDVSPDAIDPFVREGFEAGYRVSQMVPWVNLPIPLLQIAAASADPEQSVPQAAINQLLLTLPPVGIAYYGYDQVADLLNVEDAAAALKEDFYRTVWDTLDPLEILHERGESGLP
ncbi:hypothetical protein MCHIJ_06050 [Mycolicibacterium chitae]|uniref:Uncharacterized protein n=1 Tax=Mycolicibacterium chitae TaxID=1792 RepID=A0A448IC25_MYCCI|nr:hypothetical protein [Mycolicibacterium chitae]MCV7108151.1 hypothetical protein [Mycolicibacterium chitae]BBZ01168.1 hypothetical protein MCHIJ_06050 [Mycolicibacterium chitae]VEG50006.1 Uncharacterised protein [Mycolicibacterium chitae]